MLTPRTRRWTRRLLPALLTTVVLPLGAQGTPDTRPTIAVLYFTNSALVDFASYAPLSKGMAEMLINEIAQNQAIRVVERDRLQPLLEEQNLQNTDRVDKETAVKIGKTLGARHMLMGSFVIDPNQNLRIDVRAVNTETSAIEFVQTVNGKARIKLYKGHCRVVGRDSASDSLFNVDFATFEADQVYNQADAEGFIKLNALRMRIAAIQRSKK
jgi:curli biogenesis system outer membrane secretion channel CsgG